MPGERGRPPRPGRWHGPGAPVRAEWRARARRRAGSAREGRLPGDAAAVRSGAPGAGSEAPADRKRGRARAPGPGRASAPAAPSAEPGPGAPQGRGRPAAADLERRRVCARPPPRARLLPPRVTRRPSARTSSIRPDRPPAPRPSITPAGGGGGAGPGGRAGAGGRAGLGNRWPPRESQPRGDARVHQAAGPTVCQPRMDPCGSQTACFYQQRLDFLPPVNQSVL